MPSLAYMGSASASSSTSRPTRQRIDTLAIKAQLGAALGENQIHYWHALRSFCTAALDRDEFEQLARGYLGKELIHLHNALIMGILHNASPGVPGPSTDDDPLGAGSNKRRKPGDPDPNAAVEVSTQKRQRLILASLPKRERQRLKLVGKLARGPISASAGTAAIGASSSLSALGPTLSAASAAGAGAGEGGAAAHADNAALLLPGGLGWAGANAEMLERKRKEQEKRKTAEEKRKIRENLTSIGARDWRGETMAQANALEGIKDKLSASTQSALVRALSASLCIDSKELPDIESLRDRMTVQAVEAGLPGGVHPQAAAMVLLALQGHIQNVIASVVGKLRPKGTGAALSEDPQPLSAAAVAALLASQGSPDAQEESETDVDEAPSRGGVFSAIENRPANGSGVGGPTLKRSLSTASLRPVTSPDGENAALPSKPSAEPLPRRDYEPSTVRLSDMAMLLDLAPQTVVEPLGMGTSERMLAPAYEGNLASWSSPSSSATAFSGSNTSGKLGGERRSLSRSGPGSSSEDDEDEVAAAV